MPASVENDQVFFEVATCRPPYTGFLVVRVDISRPRDGGLEATVVSQHDDRDVAESEAARLAGRTN